MDRSSKAVAAAFEEIAKRGERSCLFWWLVEHHDEIKERMARQRISWGVFAEQVARMGLTDRTGKTATPNTVKTTWHRAKVYVEVAPGPPQAVPTSIATQLRSMPSAPEARPIAAVASESQSTTATQALTPTMSPGLPEVSPVLGPALGGWMEENAGSDLTPEEEARAERELERMQNKLERTDLHLNL